MAFENLTDIWEQLAEQYHSNASSDYQQYQQTVGASEADINAFLEENTNQNYSVPTIQPTLFEIDYSGSPDEFMLNEQGISIPNPEYNPTYGQSIMVENPLPPIVNISQSDSVLNKWADPITFSLFAEAALLGVTPPQTPQSSTILGEVDYFGNDMVTGFSSFHQYPNSLFVGIGGESPNLTYGEDGVGLTQLWTNTDYGDFPGPVNMLDQSNIYSSGFTNDLVHKDPSLFTGIDENSIPNNWDPTTSLYSGISWENGEVTFDNNWSSENPWISANNLPAGDATEWTPPEGFTYQNSQYGVNAITDVFSETWTYEDGFGTTPNNIPPHGTTWNTGETSLTDYYDSIHTTNPINDTFGGPVDFMTGVNSYYTEVNPDGTPKTGIPGFTNDFITAGYTFGDNSTTPWGNSKYLNGDGTMISTGTHTRPLRDPDGGTMTFDTTWSSANPWTYTNQIPSPSTGTTTWDDILDLDDFTYSGNTIYSSHPNPTIHFGLGGSISTGGTGGTGYLVDFMGGRSLHNDSQDTSSDYYIRGFTEIDDVIRGGFTSTNSFGTSKFRKMWDQGAEGKPLKTSLHSVFLNDLTDTTVDFSGVANEEPTFPGGYTADATQGDSIFFNESNEIVNPDTGEIGTTMHTITGYGDDENLTFVENSNLFSTTTTTLQNGTDDINIEFTNDDGNSHQFETLYNIDQTVTENKFGVIDNFKLSDSRGVDPSREAERGTLFDITSLGILNIPGIGIEGTPGTVIQNTNEPYVISEVGDESGNPSQIWPLSSTHRDFQRIGKFLSSTAGDSFILEQNLLGTFQTYKTIYDPGSTILNILAPSEGVGLPMVNFTRDTGVFGGLVDAFVPTTYSEWLDARAQGKNPLGVPKADDRTYAERETTHKPPALALGDVAENVAEWAVNQIPGIGGGGGGVPKAEDAAGINRDSGVNSKNNIPNSMDSRKSPLGNLGKGDTFTLKPIHILEPDETISTNETDGMPFYFRDLRDNSVIFFRAYIEGLSDTITPNWSSENYVGRSEPVYTYTNSERELSFSLKLFAQTKDELNMIYTKMNRLTSLAYPEYKKQVVLKDGEIDEALTAALGTSRIMMKAPLTKFRLGELFGSDSAEMTGFIKSLTYSFPDESPWEIQNGYRVPKFITAEIGYQVIHSEVPSLDFARPTNENGETNTNSFYGINKTLGVDYDPSTPTTPV